MLTPYTIRHYRYPVSKWRGHNHPSKVRNVMLHATTLHSYTHARYICTVTHPKTQTIITEHREKPHDLIYMHAGEVCSYPIPRVNMYIHSF
jgi:hypothetical protein